MYQIIKNYVHASREYGLIPAVLNKLQLPRLSRGHTVSMRSKYASTPLQCRGKTSDIEVFWQIFLHREYRCLDHVKSADLIIDCGANVGYSAAYFLSRYPNSQLIAVEPDMENFNVLQSNVDVYGERATCIHAGVWSKSCGLVFSPETMVAGKEWGRTVREAKEGERSDARALDIGGILEMSGKKRISILKIDIEGSEAAVFSENYESWIDKVDNLVIELHGAECEKIFHSAIANRGFALSRCDELTVCLR
jgi:FkbM family methyltransferase